MDIIDNVVEAFWELNDILWYVAFALIALFGIYATVRFRGIQITRMRHALSLTMGDIRGGSLRGRITSFEAFCISMAARIGVGNIVGTGSAILIGGPGAIFWMWVFAVTGAASSFVETVIAQIFKERKSDGECYGGPAYYAEKGLGSRKAGITMAVIICLMFAVGFTGIECCNASAAMCNAFQFENNKIIIGLLITLIFVPIVLGGARRVAKVSAKVIPFMALAWIVFALAVIAVNFRGIPNAVFMIFDNAFDVPSAVGGGIGTAIIIGMKRGILSNEAGIGTVTSVSAVADVAHPAKQGYIQAFGVLVDTFFICTLTAFVILSFGSYGDILAVESGDALVLIQGITSSTIGSAATYLVALFIFMFAFTCLVSDFLTSETNIRFVKDSKPVIIGFRLFLICMVFASCLIGTEEMFEILDILMAVTGIANIILIAKLRKHAVEAKEDYERQLAEGKVEPVFTKDALSDPSNVTEWD